MEHSVVKTLAAFLNSEGGTLLIGVDDERNVLGLETDFASFSKPDKLDEFQKHFDNLLAKTLGDGVHRHLSVDFPEWDGKTVCRIAVRDKAPAPVYLKDENNNEQFYIRRLASTKDLSISEATKYINEHWKA
jgi:predicted HTH transcriptional regulator